jgi:hypothetical protein
MRRKGSRGVGLLFLALSEGEICGCRVVHEEVVVS